MMAKAASENLDQWLKEALGIDLNACSCCGGELVWVELPTVWPQVQPASLQTRPTGPPTRAKL